MKRQLSDEQLDSLMRVIVTDASADEAVIDEVGDSPAVWWSVQRQINQQKEAGAISSFPKFWRLLAVGVPVAAAILVTSFFVLRPAGNSVDLAANQPPVAAPVLQTPVTDGVEQSSIVSTTTTGTESLPLIEKRTKTASAKLVTLAKPSNTTSATVTKKAAEIKTEFIALSYARNPESGQIVRVKVPSSMMVALGLVATVEKPSALVDAEVIVGDDGLTRAIRFIH